MNINFIIIRTTKDRPHKGMDLPTALGLYESKRKADLKAATLNHQWPKYTYTVCMLTPQIQI